MPLYLCRSCVLIRPSASSTRGSTSSASTSVPIQKSVDVLARRNPEQDLFCKGRTPVLRVFSFSLHDLNVRRSQLESKTEFLGRIHAKGLSEMSARVSRGSRKRSLLAGA